MDIAAMSIVLNQGKVQQQASLSVMKMAMNTSEIQMNDLVQMMQENAKIMEQSIQPHLGSNLDVKL
jgi:hypothetical protein